MLHSCIAFRTEKWQIGEKIYRVFSQIRLEPTENENRKVPLSKGELPPNAPPPKNIKKKIITKKAERKLYFLKFFG